MPRRPGTAGPLARLVKTVDFERVLGVRRRAATAHFAVHHLAGFPASFGKPGVGPLSDELSTISASAGALPVDDLPRQAVTEARAWVGAVVPKRHARRAVTRSLIKRQIYAAAERHCQRLGPGLWIVRLRSPFDRSHFVSAASQALRSDTRAELETLLLEAAATPAPPR